MPGIFDDERHETGPIWPNPYRTLPLWPLDVVAKGLKWLALLRLSRLASGQRGNADTITIIIHRP